MWLTTDTVIKNMSVCEKGLAGSIYLEYSTNAKTPAIKKFY